MFLATFNSLTRKSKETVALLQVGTLLEYADLMLYIHMAVLLNELFFPKTDLHTQALLTAWAFCSTYALRPLGAWFFGHIGDRVGRKITIIISSFMMGVSCILMANLPTYAEVGITAAYGVTFCRILQSLSSQGEIIGAEIYLTEMTTPPLRYLLVSLTSFFASFGGLLAISFTTLVSLLKINWRVVFWIGAAIAAIGFVARTKVQETPVFSMMKKRQHKKAASLLKSDKKVILAYFCISCGYPICFYLSFIHFGITLKNAFGYSPQQLINHNFWIAALQSLSFLFYALLSYRINPLTILRFKLLLFTPVMFFYPYLIDKANTPSRLFLLQVFIMCFGIIDIPAAGIIMNHFPVLKRFKATSLSYAFSRILVYVITSFGFIYLTDYFGQWGIWAVIMVFCLCFAWAVEYFIRLEKGKCC